MWKFFAFSETDDDAQGDDEDPPFDISFETIRGNSFEIANESAV